METERMSAISSVLTHMLRMNMAAWLNTHIPAPDGRKEQCVGEQSALWPDSGLSQANQQRKRVRGWASQRFLTLHGYGTRPLSLQDVTDDRLAEVRPLLSSDLHRQTYEQVHMGQVMHVCTRSATGAPIDTPTAWNRANVDEQELLHVGHRHNHRADLPQRARFLASRDPLEIPLAPDVLSRNLVDDPLSLPISACGHSGRKQQGMLSVGDDKLAAWQTPARHRAQGDCSLCTLAPLHAPPAQVSQNVEIRCTHLTHGTCAGMAHGPATAHTMTARVDGETPCWQERRIVTRSAAVAYIVHGNLHRHVQKARHALPKLAAWRQDNARLTKLAEEEENTNAILTPSRLLQIQIQKRVPEPLMRAFHERLPSARHDLTLALTRWRGQEKALTQALSERGRWTSATTCMSAQRLACLPGRLWSLAPLSVPHAVHPIGLVRALPLALCVLSVLEGVKRQRPGEHKEEVAGHPTRRTARPTARGMLAAGRAGTLTVICNPDCAQRHMMPLSPPQQQVALCGFTPAVSPQLAADSSDWLAMDMNGMYIKKELDIW